MLAGVVIQLVSAGDRSNILPIPGPNAALSSSTTAAADSAKYALEAASLAVSSATAAPNERTDSSVRSPPLKRAAMARTRAAIPKSWPIKMSLASAPLVLCVIGSKLDLRSLRPSGSDTRGISVKAAVSASAKPWRAPERPEPRPRARRLSAYTSTGEHPSSAGPSTTPFASPPPPPPIKVPSSAPPGTCSSCACLSSFTRLTADSRRVSASMFAKSQKCCNTCPGTSSRTMAAGGPSVTRLCLLLQ